MELQADPINIHEIDRCNIVQQTAFWAEVKHRQGIDPIAFSYHAPESLLDPHRSPNRQTDGDLLVLVRPVDDQHTVAYVPYGPIDEPEFENHGRFLEELSEVLHPHLPHNCILIRYDLPWENQWAAEDDLYDAHGNWKGPPDHEKQEFRVNFNTHNWNLLKSRSDNLPTNTIFLNLQNDRETLIHRMKPKTRYNIRLSHRKGVSVKSYGMEHIDTWYNLYAQTARRNGVTLHSPEYFRSVLTSREQHIDENVDVRLLMADHHGEFLAAMFLVISNNRGTYLYGASSDQKRNMMATYALQWEAIRLAQANGCTEYDMFGVAPNANPAHPLHGLYRFKSGFGGKMFHRMGCWDYPLNAEQYTVFRAMELNSQAYHVH